MTMSLGRLLAAGKSLIGAHDGAGRYRVNKHIALPKFISPRNPFASTGKTECPSAHAEPSTMADVKLAVAPAAKAHAAAPGTTRSRIARTTRVSGWWSEWVRKLNQLPRLKRKPGSVKSLIPRPAKAPIQSEFSLDKVQVVRNDLSDTDFEVVSAKTMIAVSRGTSALTAQPKLEPAGNTWNRVVSRIFGAGQARF